MLSFLMDDLHSFEQANAERNDGYGENNCSKVDQRDRSVCLSSSRGKHGKGDPPEIRTAANGTARRTNQRREIGSVAESASI